MGGKGGGGQNTIQKADPWSEVQPFLKDVYPRALAWLESDLPQYFPYQTVAPESRQTMLARSMLTNRAMGGSPLEFAAQRQNLGTVSGNYLNSNPGFPVLSQIANGINVPGMAALNATAGGQFLNQQNPNLQGMVQNAINPITQQYLTAALPNIASQFALAGRYGSGAQQDAITKATEAYGRTVAGTSADIQGQAYAMERQLQSQAQAQAVQAQIAQEQMRAQAAQAQADAYNKERYYQEQAAALAPQLAGIDYNRIQSLATAGQSVDQRNQQILEDAINRWNFQQNIPLEKIKEYNNILMGGAGLGGTTQTSMPGARSNPLTGAIGGAMTGYAAGPAIAGMFGSAAAGAGGAAAGAQAGSTAGPWGALIGAVLGGLLS
ncbi:MAG: hypothetical protein [Podoviridae sp. ctQNx1]|nr:MAG: hypothetical protein [Podoviridae sp. ctQNx1]UOF78088.1 multidrug/pheromone exporter [Caudoviricetes sp.]